MIDFRYHLVSIVSIFLALAVGIVLGAGPLKGDLGTRLTQQTTALRAEKAQLRTDLDTARRDAAARDTFFTAVAPAVVKNRLGGKTVALVVAPGVDADLVKNVTTTLLDAGAKVGSTTTLTDAWADPSKATMRNTVATPFAALVKAPAGANGPNGPDQLAAALLARAILSGTDLATQRVAPAASAALKGLKDGDLISVAPEQIVPATSVVFLSGVVKGSTPQDAEARVAAYLQLARLLDAGGSGAEVVGKTNTTTTPADGTISGDLVSAVRRDPDAVKALSTVDDADLPMGMGTLVMALAQQYTGEVGHYGLAPDAKAVLPDLTVKK